MVTPDEARRELARRELARRRGQTPTPQAATEPQETLGDQIHAFAGNALEGIPVAGPYIRSGADILRAGLQSTFGSGSYDENRAAADARFAENTEAFPKTAIAGQITGGVLGTAPLVAAAPTAFGAGAGGLAARTAFSAGSGTLLGGADAAVRNDGDLWATAKGAGLGFGVGLLAPGLGHAVGKGVGAVADKFRTPGGALAGVSAPAARYGAEAIQDPTRLSSELQRLGPQGMLADVSPEWMGVARGAASRPGSRDAVVNALLERDNLRNARLASDLDASLGQAPIPSRINASIGQNMDTASQAYGPIMGQARAANTEQLASTLDVLATDLRGPAQKAAMQVRSMLDIPGSPGTLDPSPNALLQTRQAIDGMFATETNPKVIGVLSQARQAVDTELTRVAPGIKDVDAAFAELARQREGLERGGMVLSNGKTAIRPQEMADEFGQAALPQGAQVGPSAVPLRIQQGTRADIDRIVGTNANDPAALQRTVRSEGDWNRDKLRTVFGRERADQALNAIDRETAFYRTAGRVTSGSDTAMAQRFGDFLDDAAKAPAVPTDTTLTGATARGVQKVAQALFSNRSEGNAQKFAEQLGRLSVATGDSRDKVVAALIDLSRRQQTTPQVRARVASVAEALLAGTGQVGQRPLAR